MMGLNRNDDDDFYLTKNLFGNDSLSNLKEMDKYPINKFGIFVPSFNSLRHPDAKYHSHPSYMFKISPNGMKKLKIEDEIIKIKSGKLYAISPFMKHHEISEEEFSRFYAVLIDKDYFENILSLYSIKPYMFKGDYFESSISLIYQIKEYIVEYESHGNKSR